MQNQVRDFIAQNRLNLNPQTRFVDLVSEVGELGKGLLLAGNYGAQPLAATAGIRDEAGDCLFALLALCEALEIDAADALTAAMDKYRCRRAATGTVGSDGGEPGR